MSKPKPSPSDSPSEMGREVGAEILDAYNDVAIGIDLLYEAAISGDRPAFYRMKAIANHIIFFAGRCKEGKTRNGG